MTPTNQTRQLNNASSLESEKHTSRLYFQTLRARSPQFTVSQLTEDMHQEVEYWHALFTSTGASATLLETVSGLHYVFSALKHEKNALKDIERALGAQRNGAWAEASVFYSKALNDFHFALSDWTFAVHGIADDTPFDPYYPTPEERTRHNVEDPPRSSYAEMCQVSPSLFRIFFNMDRVQCLEQELIQRQITCLTTYMQGAEEQETDTKEDDQSK